MPMESEATYLVVDDDGFKVVVNSGGVQTVIAGPSSSLEDCLRQALQSRNWMPIAIRLTPC